jgi:hypothetical protein
VTALRAVLEEMSMRASEAAFAFCPYLDTTTQLGDADAKRLLVCAMDFSGKHLGRVYSPGEGQEVQRLFAAL